MYSQINIPTTLKLIQRLLSYPLNYLRQKIHLIILKKSLKFMIYTLEDLKPHLSVK